MAEFRIRIPIVGYTDYFFSAPTFEEAKKIWRNDPDWIVNESYTKTEYEPDLTLDIEIEDENGNWEEI